MDKFLLNSNYDQYKLFIENDFENIYSKIESLILNKYYIYEFDIMLFRKEINFRHVVYICMMPKSLCSEGTIKKRKKAFDELRTTNHWVTKPKLFSKLPRTYGKDVPDIVQIKKPILTDIGKKLIG